MNGFVDFILQIKSLLMFIIGTLGTVYFIKSGALENITGSWKRQYEAAARERDDALRRCSVKDEKIADLEEYIKILILNDKTKMEIRLQDKK